MSLSVRRVAERMNAELEPLRVWGDDRTLRDLETSRHPEDARSLAELHRSTPDSDRRSLRELLSRHGERADDADSIRLVAYNAALTPDATLQVDGPFGLRTTVGFEASNPNLEARSRAIGRRFADHDVDVAALSEVFDDRELTGIVESWNEELGDAVSVSNGPTPSRRPFVGALLDVAAAGTLVTIYGIDAAVQTLTDLTGVALEVTIRALSSGLRTVTDGVPVAETSVHEFEARGWPTRDADFWSNKGSLLTRLDVGDGRMDLYSTHLLAGGGLHGEGELPDPMARLIDYISDEGIARSPAGYRALQLDELVDFIRATHEPSHPMLLVGDFNIDASTDEYRRLVHRLDAIRVPVVERGGSPRNFVQLVLDRREQVRSAVDAWVRHEAAAEDPVFAGGLGHAIRTWLEADAPKEVEFLRALAVRHTESLASILGWDVDVVSVSLYDVWRATQPTSGPTFFFGESRDDPEAICEWVDEEPGITCDEDAETIGPIDGGRIDYVFASRPRPHQDQRMELSRPRRRPYPTDEAARSDDLRARLDDDESDFLSDHLGLEISVHPWS